MLRSRTIRPAFSLLEMLLALALAMVVLLGLYLTLSTYITNAHIGRDTLAEGETGRSIMARFTNDITNQVGAQDTRSMPDYSAVTQQAATTDPAATPMSGTTPMPMTPVDSVIYNNGIWGDTNSLILSTYRVEKPSGGQVVGQPQGEITSDLRRINYWLVRSGPETIGLARREIKLATATDIDAGAADVSEAEKYIIAREVKDITFEFFDGKSWQGSWDGAAPVSAEVNTPMGPPAAVKITVTLRRNVNKALAIDPNVTLPDIVYSHVIAVPAANNFTPKATTP